MIKEKAYKYKNYQISYDEGLIDRSALVIGTKEKDTLYITGELYDESANAVIKILDNLQTQLQQKENIIKEVREYIEEWQRFPHTNGSTHKELKNLIDILDKENK